MNVLRMKTGDKVRNLTKKYDMTIGNIYTVRGIDTSDNSLSVTDDVGDLSWMFNGDWEPVHTLSPNDTGRLKSGEPFTTGSYTATVDSATEDKVILTHGSWLPLDAVEKVEALTVEVGKTYVAANGTAVKISDLLGHGFIRDLGDGFVWRSDGICSWARGGDVKPWRLIGEVDKKATEPPADKPKFKIGDRVRVNDCDDKWESTIVGFDGADFIVEKADGWESEEYGPGFYRLVNDEHLTLLDTTAAIPAEPDATSLTVKLSLDTEDFQADLADAVRAAGISNAPTPDNDDFVTVSISGHPVAVADFLAVLR